MKQSEVQWDYNNSPLTEPIKGSFGFVYLIEYENGKKYIGRKQFYKKVTLPALKSGIQRPNSTRVGKNKNGKRVYYDVLYKESDWKTYEGSLELPEGYVVAKKYILALAKDYRELTYLEVKHLFCYDVLETRDFLNKNINNNWFKPKELT